MADAENDGVKVPVTLEEYCVQASTSRNEQDDDCILGNQAQLVVLLCALSNPPALLVDDLDDLDPYDIDDYDEQDDSQCNSNTDSGNEET